MKSLCHLLEIITVESVGRPVHYSVARTSTKLEWHQTFPEHFISYILSRVHNILSPFRHNRNPLIFLRVLMLPEGKGSGYAVNHYTTRVALCEAYAIRGTCPQEGVMYFPGHYKNPVVDKEVI